MKMLAQKYLAQKNLAQKNLALKTSVLAAFAMGALVGARPAFAADATLDKANAAYDRGQYGEAFKSYAVLARQDETAAQFKLATLYYMAHDDVRAMMWFLITGANSGDGQRKAAALGNADDISRRLPEARRAEAMERAKLCMRSGYVDCGW